MTANRPAVRNVTDVQIPWAFPAPAAWYDAATRVVTDVATQASRQWLDLWFANLTRSNELWWAGLRSRG